MSSAWEILEKQSKEKIDDATASEARLNRMSVEVNHLRRLSSLWRVTTFSNVQHPTESESRAEILWYYAGT